MTAVDWVERATKLTLTPDQARCVETLCSIAAPYNLHFPRDGWSKRSANSDVDETCDVEIHPQFIRVYLCSPLSTYDSAGLTRLVLAAHRNCVRVELAARTIERVDPDCTISRWDSASDRYVDTDEHPVDTIAVLEVTLHPLNTHPSLAAVWS